MTDQPTLTVVQAARRLDVQPAVVRRWIAESVQMGDPELPRIFAEFNTHDLENRILIPTHVEPALLEWLRPGMAVVLYEPNDIAVRATVVYDQARGRWYGMPDWSTLEDLQIAARARRGHRIAVGEVERVKEGG